MRQPENLYVTGTHGGQRLATAVPGWGSPLPARVQVLEQFLWDPNLLPTRRVPSTHFAL